MMCWYCGSGGEAHIAADHARTDRERRIFERASEVFARHEKLMGEGADWIEERIRRDEARAPPRLVKALHAGIANAERGS